MNRSNTSPRSFSTDQLRTALGDVGGPARPDYLPDIVEQAGRMRQRPAWTLLGTWLPMDIAGQRQGVPRAVVLLAVLSLLVALLAAGLYVGAQRTQPERPLGLPTTPDAWQRVVINSGTEGRVEAVAAGPRGLLAAVGEGDESRLFFSADGRDWTSVPVDQHGPVGHNGAALVATDQGFLLVGNEVLASEDGLSWRRIAGPDEAPSLRAGMRIAAIASTAAGPGLVAVGSDNKAWYSTDGTDWTLANVPEPPGEPSQLERPLDRTQTQGTVEMGGVAASGRNLIAWGISIWVHDDGSATFVPVLWASNNGRSWTMVDAPQWAYPNVAAGPNGFAVTSEDGSVWRSTDGTSWERVAENAFGSSRWPALRNDDGHRVEMHVGSIAAGPAGYVAVGADGICLLRCPSAETVIWTSPDGRSWSRLPNDDLFRAPTGAGANVAATSESAFVVGGEYDGKPAIWISGSAQSGSGANAGAAPAPATPTDVPSSAPTPSSAPSIQDIWGFEPLGPIEPGAYFIDPDLDPSTPLRVEYEVPAQGWSQWAGGAKFSDVGHVGVSITTVVNLVTDGCRDHTWADPPVGPSVDDLATALADLGPFQVTSPPTDVTIYGYSGKHLELTVPDLPVEGTGDNQQFTGCTGGELRSWVAPFDTASPGDAFYGYTGPGYREEFWILDVEGTRLMVAAEQSPNSPAEDVAERDAILDSIRIEP